MTDTILDRYLDDYRGTVRRGQLKQQDEARKQIDQRIDELAHQAWVRGYETAQQEVLA